MERTLQRLFSLTAPELLVRMKTSTSTPSRKSESELVVFRPVPFREAAYGFANIRAGLFDLLHVEPS